jgi:aspartate carbamoyltransferase regulatory subunit
VEVLKGFNLEIYRPRILVIEANTTVDEIKLDNYLVEQKKYFKAKRLIENIFYCRDSSDVQNILKINIKNYVSKSHHPLGEKYDLPAKKYNSSGFFNRIFNKVRGIVK